MTSVLIVESKTAIRDLLKGAFPERDIYIDSVRTIDKILELFSATAYDILIWQTDISKQDRNHGVELLEVISKDSPRTQIIIISDEKDLDMAVEGIRAGAYQYMVQPINKAELVSLIDLALQKQPVVGESTLLSPMKRLGVEFHGISSVNVSMQDVILQIKEAAATDISVLVTGETGTGKDLVAAAIHNASALKDEPYVVVHTGAMPEDLIASELLGYEKGAFTGAETSNPGNFEQADGGTIFLDEIGTMDQKVQVSLLRLLEKSSFQRLGGRKKINVNVRVIAATNEDLWTAVQEGRFREDLFYRFDVFHIALPPLRKRPGDIALLSRQFIHQFSAKYNKHIGDISPEAASYLERYNWPGNVRELKNIIQRAVLMARTDMITADLLPARLVDHNEPITIINDSPIKLGMNLEDVELTYIQMMMAYHNNNKSKVAKALGISRKSLYNKLGKIEDGTL
ncbi:MAG: sigma-54 dependent transcriptional regulator [bacterium]|nr:sigma-54 dependent transcriptional regulator [bacterium]